MPPDLGPNHTTTETFALAWVKFHSSYNQIATSMLVNTLNLPMLILEMKNMKENK